MYRIDNATAIGTIPTPAAVGPNPNSYFTKGNPSVSELATIVDDDWLNAIQEELANVIENAGITLSKTNRTQLLQAIQALVNGTPYAVSSSSANTYVASISPVPVAYTTGMLVLIKFTHGNTGAATINLNSLGAESVKRLDGSSLSSGDIYDGMIGLMSYDGTNFQLLNAQVVKPSSILNNSFNYAADVGSANTLSATLTPSPAAYTAGMSVFIKVAATNTGASTINLNGLGAKNIKRDNLSNPLPGDLIANQISELIYDGTQFQIKNPGVIGMFNVVPFLSSGTYTPSAQCKRAIIRIGGGGGGGGGSGSSATGGAGGTGGTTSFGAIISATGGGGSGVGGGSGGTGGVGSSGNITNLVGGHGSAGVLATTGVSLPGGNGGDGVYGGAGGFGTNNGGYNAAANTGGGGGGSGATVGCTSGAGGGAGGYSEHLWLTPSVQTVTIGAGGTAGAAGTSGNIGGVGGSGFCYVLEHC